jgi:hypothetical protein
MSQVLTGYLYEYSVTIVVRSTAFTLQRALFGPKSFNKQGNYWALTKLHPFGDDLIGDYEGSLQKS